MRLLVDQGLDDPDEAQLSLEWLGSKMGVVSNYPGVSVSPLL